MLKVEKIYSYQMSTEYGIIKLKLESMSIISGKVRINSAQVTQQARGGGV